MKITAWSPPCSKILLFYVPRQVRRWGLRWPQQFLHWWERRHHWQPERRKRNKVWEYYYSPSLIRWKVRSPSKLRNCDQIAVLSYLDRLHNSESLALGQRVTNRGEFDVNNITQFFLQPVSRRTTPVKAWGGEINYKSIDVKNHRVRTWAKSEIPIVATSPSTLAYSWLLAYLALGITATSHRNYPG